MLLMMDGKMLWWLKATEEGTRLVLLKNKTVVHSRKQHHMSSSGSVVVPSHVDGQERSSLCVWAKESAPLLIATSSSC